MNIEQQLEIPQLTRRTRRVKPQLHLPAHSPDWTRYLDAALQVRFRIDLSVQKRHVLPGGTEKSCSDMQWFLGGGFVEGQVGTALMLTRDGEEVLPNPFIPQRASLTPRKRERVIRGRDKAGNFATAVVVEGF